MEIKLIMSCMFGRSVLNDIQIKQMKGFDHSLISAVFHESYRMQQLIKQYIVWIPALTDHI